MLYHPNPRVTLRSRSLTWKKIYFTVYRGKAHFRPATLSCHSSYLYIHQDMKIMYIFTIFLYLKGRYRTKSDISRADNNWNRATVLGHNTRPKVLFYTSCNVRICIFRYVYPAKIQISLCIYTFWSKSSLGTFCFFIIVLGFSDTSSLVGHFVSSPRERGKEAEEMKERDREERGTGMKRKKQKK